MELIAYSDSGEFLAETRAFLDEYPAANHRIVAIALQLKDSAEATGACFAAIWEKGGLVVAAVCNPPQHLFTSYLGEKAIPGEAMGLLVRHLAACHAPLPGVIGPPDNAETFGGLYADEMQMRLHVRRKLRVHQLTKVTPPRPCAGLFRAAVEEDKELVLDWVVAFEKDIGEPLRRPEILDRVTRRIAARDYYLWEDSQVVSMAARTQPNDRGICVSNVYTPPAFRNRGYASACVAALSQELLDSGYAYCSLYTDLANPVSNHIYGAIGYVPVCDAINIEFHAL